MLHSILSRLYEIPLVAYLIIIAVFVALWTVLTFLFQKQTFWKGLNIVLFVLSVILIISVTLIFRQTENKGFSLIPFSSFELARIHNDVYKEMMLNVVLFFPVGLTMPYVLNRKTYHPVIVTLISAMLFSSLIEVMQYVFMRGYAEIDDVIFNSLGTAFGGISFFVYNRFTKNTLFLKKKYNN